MSLWGKFSAIILITILGVIPTVQTTHAVSAQTLPTGCNPIRTDDTTYYRWNGWEYPGPSGADGTEIGGVNSVISNYSNYADDDTIDGDNSDDYDWVMLNSDPGSISALYAQVGYMTGNQIEDPWEVGDTPSVVVEFDDTTQLYANGLPIQQEHIIQSDGDSSDDFEVLYNYNGDGEMTFWMNTTPGDGSPLYDTDQDTALSSINGDVGWLPLQAEIAAETHTYADQTMGDTANPVTFSDSGYWYNWDNHGLYTGWSAMDNSPGGDNPSGPVTTVNVGTNNNGVSYTNNTEFGQQLTSDSSMNIWDYACTPQEIAYNDLDDNGRLENTSLQSIDPGADLLAGTSPSIAQLSNGSYEVAYHGAHGSLWVYNSGTGEGTDTDQGMGTSNESSPSITALADGAWVVALETNTDDVNTTTSSGGGVATGYEIYAGSNPSITTLGDGDYAVAFHNGNPDDGCNTNAVCVYSSATGGIDNTEQGMGTSESPAITGLSGDSWAAGFEANVGKLYITTSSGGGSDTGQYVASGSSPSAATLNDGSYVVAFHDGGTADECSENDDCIYLSDDSYVDTGDGMGSTSYSPTVTAIDQDAWVSALEANTGKVITTTSWGGGVNTGNGVASGSFPTIAP